MHNRTVVTSLSHDNLCTRAVSTDADGRPGIPGVVVRTFCPTARHYKYPFGRMDAIANCMALA